ncbi:methyltransferase domain-containing protein [Streptomyces harbinensis]|uniref:class I SAM-dependent methyltransferase n=1 Tax=Streptomyces harbinensis TaxID=1176198 RepID=UPI0033936644
MNDVAFSPPPSPSPVLPGRRAGGWTFLLEAARDLRTTGAVAPSGRALARVLTEPVRAARGARGPRPLSVLEAGAGTGAVTRVLLARLPVGGELDIVEANPRFAAGLDRLAAAYRAGPGGRAGRVAVHRGLVEEFGAGRRYDVIVSGLPLTNFTPEQVERIMARYLELLRPGGTLSYFAYLGTGAARSLVASRAEARRHAAVEEVMAGYQRRYGVARWRVWANLPPAGVWHLRR